MTATSPTFDLRSPSSGEVIAQIPDHGAAEARGAADRAVTAFASWRRTTAYARAALLRKFFDLMLRDEQEIAGLIAREMGKPVTEALGEVRYAASFIEWYAEEAKRVYGDIVPSQVPGKRLFVTQEPVGPVYAVTPWNFPAAMATRKIAPALAAGCTVILKPAEQSPLTALKMRDLWTEAGGPADTFQVITASDPVVITKVMMDDVRIRKVTFTGSTEVGRLLAAQAAPTLKRVSLELGGHAPYLIFADADLEQAVTDVIACKFRNAGQTCVCTNRIYVQREVLEDFTARLTKAVAALKTGDPLDASTQIGPLVDGQGLEKVKRHVDDALAKGAVATIGGEAGEGLYFQPTVLTGVTPDMLVMREETFGPVAPLVAFDTEEEAVQAANDTEFGLAAYLWTTDLDRAFRVSERLEYGIIGLNDPVPSTAQAPFGGVKQSGYGREGGPWGIQEYLNTKYLSVTVR
ncbi:NAD-dependent succinate-semialdehyde dehydrogenase [Deinococcus frigens]|uniref:NAD-dependent succinate-semialdehyde dehydrogenase n=1 Tax=Deinococcus frigens TaxID=249403 RepID=UPI00068D6031|nr:NAD-dependent succinate-semialdehyde dehydrogenase [Deinococcus frigens]